MLIKIFKIISVVVLLSVLITLIQKRDLITNRTHDSFEKISSSIALDGPMTLPNIELKTEATVRTIAKKLEDIVTTSTTTSNSQPKVSIIDPTTRQVTITPKEAIYEPMIPSATSDTDESYQPDISPCTVTMGFKIGILDPRFGISKDEFIGLINSSAETWGSPINKELFKYTASGPLTINLIYDERQERTVDIGYFGLEIENSKQAAENLKNSYEEEKNVYMVNAEQYTKDAEIFKATYTAYEEKVVMYNQKGGASQQEYNDMMVELAKIQNEQKLLEERRLQLMATMESINTKVEKYNKLVVYINSLIRKSNALGAAKFTEGRFTPSNNTIDIYQFSDGTKLKRVITHELGHVIGINHNDNPASIMYSINSGSGTALTNEDIMSLKESCAK